MAWLTKVLAFDRTKVDLRRALLLFAFLAALLVVVVALGARQYAMSALFGALFAVVADPGGAFASRVKRLSLFALIGAAGTALGFAVGGAFWVWPVVSVFVVTLVAGLSVRWGLHRFAAALLHNVWFVIALFMPAWYTAEHVHSEVWLQAAAWLAGVAAWLGVACVAWLLHGQIFPCGFSPKTRATRHLCLLRPGGSQSRPVSSLLAGRRRCGVLRPRPRSSHGRGCPHPAVRTGRRRGRSPVPQCRRCRDRSARTRRPAHPRPVRRSPTRSTPW